MKPAPSPRTPRRCWFRTGLLASLAALVPACRTGPPDQPTPPATPKSASVPEQATSPAALAEVVGPVPGDQGSARPSSASTPRAYRQDAAIRLYALNAERIYKGRLPPMLYAVGVLDVDIDAAGRVLRTRWLRAPKHAPEVMKDIEALVRAAGPYPAPVRMGKVTWTDTWLWHKSGRFQLDTLTEGQD